MRRFAIALLIVAASCLPIPADNPRATKTPFPAATKTPLPTVTASPTITPTPTEEPARIYNFLLLGGDWRAHRQGTRYGDKTDVMLLVSIKMEKPARISVVQFPRNFWTPVEAFPDMWLFHVYRREGFIGLHYYFQQVFGMDLDGIFYIHMDNFATLVDDVGGVFIGGTIVQGEDLLAYLRDNENNWGCPEYDCGNRQYKTLLALGNAFHRYLRDDPIVAARVFVGRWGGLIETDWSAFDYFVLGAQIAWEVLQGYEVEFYKLTRSGCIEYGDTPLEVRGWIVSGDVKTWMQEVTHAP